MGDVVAMRGQTVGQMLAQLNQLHAAGNLQSMVVAGIDRDNNVSTGITVMTVERAVYLADALLQEARST